MNTRIGLICGYRKTGKDGLYSILTGSTLEERFQWRVYRNGSSSDLKSEQYIRISFADRLKVEASSIYNIPEIISDEDKDIKQFIHYKTGELVSARDIYIEHGTYRRNQDIDYWCKKACESIDNSSETLYLVTDWRFNNEVEYMSKFSQNLFTMRLYRSDVPEPDIHIASEHNLDNYQTDLLLLPDNYPDEFQKAIKRFPQYTLYIPCELI